MILYAVEAKEKHERLKSLTTVGATLHTLVVPYLLV